MSWLNDLKGKSIEVDGVPLPDRKKLRILGHATGADNPGEDATDVTISIPAPTINVPSVFGRTGPIAAQAGDYDADQVDFDPTSSSLSQVNVQSALLEVNTKVDENTKLVQGVSSIADGEFFGSADANNIFRYNSASDGTFSFSSVNGIEAGQSFTIIQEGAGKFDFSLDVGQSITTPRFSTPKSAGAGSVVKVTHLGSDEYLITGDLITEMPSCRYALEAGSVTAQNGIIPIEQTVGYGGFTFDAANGQVIVPVTGKYLIFGSFYGSNASTTNPLAAALAIRVNNTGSYISRPQLTRWSSSTSANFGGEWSELWELQAGDFVTVENLTDTATVFSGANSQERSRCGLVWVSD